MFAACLSSLAGQHTGVWIVSGLQQRNGIHDMCVQVPMLRSEDHSEEEGYEQEERSSAEHENSLASSSTHSVVGGLDAGAKSKAKV